MVAARFAEKNEKVDDLLGSFIEGGLNQDEASSELLVQMYTIHAHFPHTRGHCSNTL